jgi:autotransporter-associated beta strand protein
VRRTNNPTITLEGGGISGGGTTLDQGTNVWTGPIIVNQPSILHGGVINGNVNHLLAGPISGSGRLTFLNAGGRRFDLYGTNDAFTGGWSLAGGTILRVSTNSSMGSGDITNFGTIEWFGSNNVTMSQNIAGQGVFRHTAGAGAMTFPAYFQQAGINFQNGSFDNPVTFDSTAVVEAGSISVGITNFVPAVGSSRLNIAAGAKVTVGNFFMGDANTQTGIVAQAGGDVFVTNQFRLAHWPNNLSTYTIDDGSITMTTDPLTTPSTTGVAEVAGGFYIGIDGVGIFTQNGGNVTTPNIVLDNRGTTTLSGNTNTYNLTGGTLTIGRWGILSPNQTYQINLGGGVLAASTSWTSGLRMTLTGTPVVNPGAFTITLNGPLSGGGGIVKEGPGTLLLNGTNTFSAELSVFNGSLGGNGSVAGLSYIDLPATLSPGTSVGVFTISNDLQSAGTMLMEISRSGAAVTNDLLRVSGDLFFGGGTLTVTNIGQALIGGEVFNLFDWGTSGGAFDTINLPPLAAHLSWDTTSLYVDGTIKVVGAPTITVPPVNQTAFVGDNVRFTAAATSGVPFSVRWQQGGVDIPGATSNTLVLNNVQTNTAGTYTFVASNQFGELSASATLTVLEVTNLAHGLIAYWPLDTVSGTFTPDVTTNGNHLFLTNMTATNVVAGQRSNAMSFFTNVNSLLTRSYGPGNALPAYQYPSYTVALWVKGPTNQVDRRVFSESHSNANNQLLNIGTFNTASTNGAVDIFIRTDAGGTALVDHRKTTLQAFNDQWHHITLVDSDGQAAVYVDGVRDTNNFNYVRGVLTLNTITLGGIQRAAASAWFQGQIDDVMIWRRGLNSNEVATVAANALGGPPVITQQPTDQSVACSGTATFTVAGTSIDVIRYQWYYNDSPITGATNATLNYLAGPAGSFFAVLSNVAGAVTSTVATLTVNNTPGLISPAGPLAVGAESNSCGDLVLAGGAAYRWELSDAAGPAGLGWDILNVVSGDIDVTATSGNPFTVNLVSLNGNALGLAANWNNNATNVYAIATASGAVNGFAANKFALDDSLFANDLAGGVFSIEEGSIAVRFTPNQAPVSNAVTNNRAPHASLKLNIADLVASATSDPDGDGRALVGVSPTSTNGVSITTNATYIFYSNLNSVEDEFTYTVRDLRSYRPGDTVRTTTGTIRITVSTPAGTNQNFVSFAVVEGKPTMRFAGVPGYTYDVQRATDLTPPVSWQTLHTTNAPPLGLFDFVDENPPVGSAYYRTALP